MHDTFSRQNEYQVVQQRGQDIMEKINDRNRIRRAGGNHARVWIIIKLCLHFHNQSMNRKKQLTSVSCVVGVFLEKQL